MIYGPLSDAQKAYLDRVIRVDQAGELGANYIYMGQYAVLASKYPHLKPVLHHMWEQEIIHNTFNKLQKRRVRPGLLTPLWKLGAIGMGVGTALIGKEAMACTVAVETVIGGHYNQQLSITESIWCTYMKKDGALLSPDTVEKSAQTSEELTELKNQISEFRDDGWNI